MKQQSITILLIVLISMFGAKASAYDIAATNADGKIIYYNIIKDGKELEVTYRTNKFNSYSGNVVIPNEVTYLEKTRKVTSIGQSAFSDCSGLTSVIIPYGVFSIGSWAFGASSNLTSITIPTSVSGFGGFAFEGCSEDLEIKVSIKNLSTACKNRLMYEINRVLGKPVILIDNDGNEIHELIIPNDVSSISSYAFCNCSSLTSVTIPNSVTSIGDYAFSGCKKLASIICQCSPTPEGRNIFSNCPRLKDITFDCSIVTNLFQEVPSITKITMTDNVTSIGNTAFSHCSGLTSVTIPNSVTSIGSGAFSHCSGLTSVKIPNSVTSIGNSAFASCSSLLCVIIGNSVTSIGDYAFEGCSKLTSTIIGSGVMSIGYRAFFNTDNKKTIWLTNTPPSGYERVHGLENYVPNDQYNLNNMVVYPFLSSYFDVDGIRYVPVSPSERTCDAIDCVYDKSAENIKITSTTTYKGVTMKVKIIKPYLAYNNKYIKTLVLDADGELTEFSFTNCKNMTRATLGEKVSIIGESAFSGCSSLETIDIPSAVKSIGPSAFLDCSGMVYVKIGSGVETIDESAFSGCSSLNKLTIGPHVKTINASAFRDCLSLTSVFIPQAVTEIKGNVFSGCTELKKIIMADSETELKLGSDSNQPIFSACPLDSVYIGRNISYNTSSNYGYSPFYRNTTLRAVKITDKETEISAYEFYGCTNLQRVIIGDGVTTIGDWAFSGCQSLKYFTFGSQVQAVGKESFSDCTAMAEISSKASEPPVCGTQALDDINKWECKLFVPDGCLAKYQVADQWKDFFFIEEKSIEASKKGDANGDGNVDAADIVEVVNYIKGNNSDRIHISAADANSDGVVNAGDIVMIVNIIMANI